MLSVNQWHGSFVRCILISEILKCEEKNVLRVNEIQGYFLALSSVLLPWIISLCSTHQYLIWYCTFSVLSSLFTPEFKLHIRAFFLFITGCRNWLDVHHTHPLLFLGTLDYISQLHFQFGEAVWQTPGPWNVGRNSTPNNGASY